MPRPIEKHLKRERLNPGEWISVQEAARRLGLTNVQMQRILACGPLYSRKIGSRRIVFTASVNRLIAQQQLKAAKPKNSNQSVIPNRRCEGPACDRMSPQSAAQRQLNRIQSILDSASQDVQPLTINHQPSTSTVHHSPLTTNHSPLMIERRIWRDPAHDDYWIPSDRAAGILNISSTMVCRLASWGKLKRMWADWKTNQPVDPAIFAGRRRAMFSLKEVQARANRQEEKRAGLTYGAKDPERPLRHAIHRPMNDLPPGGLVSVTEAAAILGIHRTGIAQMVRRGHLYVWQSQPGKRGSKMHLSAAQVGRIASNPDHQKRRQKQLECRRPGYKKKQRPVTDFQERYHLWETTGKALKKRHRAFYTTSQAAKALGVSTNTIHTMRANGRLKGYRSPSGGDNRRIFNRRRWWFYKIEDVETLLNSSDYQRKRKAYWKWRMPWAYGEDSDSPPLAKDGGCGAVGSVPGVGEGSVRPNEDEWYPHQVDHSPSPAEKMKLEMENW